MPFTLSSPISPEGSHGAFDAQRTSHGTATGTSMSLDTNHSPLASADGHKCPHPIAMRDMRGEFKLIPDSDQAYHGSAAPSLIKKGDYFGVKQDQSQMLHQLAEEGTDSMVVDASSPVSPARTATVDSNRPVDVQDRRVVIVDISALQPAIEARTGEAPMGFADAIKDIKRAGHSVHMLTAASAAGDAAVRGWLQAMDVSVGFGSEDDVAALWHVPGGDESAKIRVSCPPSCVTCVTRRLTKRWCELSMPPFSAHLPNRPILPSPNSPEKAASKAALPCRPSRTAIPPWARPKVTLPLSLVLRRLSGLLSAVYKAGWVWEWRWQSASSKDFAWTSRSGID